MYVLAARRRDAGSHDSTNGHVEVEPAINDVEGEQGQLLVKPEMPEREVVERHALTHLPFTPWCEACVRGRAQEEQHRRRLEAVQSVTPVLAMDYCFMGLEGEKESVATTLVIQDSVSGYAGAAVVPSKGPGAYNVASLDNFFPFKLYQIFSESFTCRRGINT